uniref:Protein odr-4 homolog n=1 Tax=Hippocampus comes TaxID=109280 RepID=A0A3Q3DI08_HIPCM
MGRGYIVDDTVEVYLSKLCEQQSDHVTGLVIGQNSIQRDFVVMACRTPSREEPLVGAGKSPDKEWISEHARQVSRMLPGGLSVIGVFVISDADAKETLLVFAVQRLISSESLWKADDNEVTDCVTLHINPKSRKISCRTFDIKDPKSLAKPADWKYQAAVCSSWSTMSCCVKVDLLVPLPDNKACTKSMDECLKEGLKVWTYQIENAVCLIDGIQLPDDAELTAGQVIASLAPSAHRSAAHVVQRCGGALSVRGAIHSRAYVHNNKPKAKLAEKVDLSFPTANCLPFLLAPEDEKQFCLPHRVFCPAKGNGSLCVCDYRFNDEDPSEVIDRLKEMLDVNAADQNLDTKQEIVAEIIESGESEGEELFLLCVAMATVIALLATAASMLYLHDI